MKFFVLALAVALTSDVHAQVYRCKTTGGTTEYSHIPCGKDAQLLQSARDSVDTVNPPADPFGVKRERDRVKRETEYPDKKVADEAGRNTVNSKAPSRAVRQIDRADCESADRDAMLEGTSLARNYVEIARKQRVADWECGRVR